MKAEIVIGALKALLSGDRERGISCVKMMEAHEQTVGNKQLAYRLRSLLEESVRQMVQLPNAPPSVTFIKPERTLESMVLTDELNGAVCSLIREWQGRERLREHGLSPRSVVLLVGPSGNGKTCLAEAIAAEVGLPFGLVNYNEIIDSHRGETGANIGKLFKFVAATSCVLMFDEADSLMTARGERNSAAGVEDARSVNQSLVGLDRVTGGSLVIFATNAPTCLDASMLRRVAMTLSLEPPTKGQAENMVAILRQRWPILGSNGTWADSVYGLKSFAAIEAAAMDAARSLILGQEFPS